MTTDNKAVVVYQKSLAPIAEKAQSIEIVDADTMKVAVEVLSELNKFNDKITEEKEKITKPLNEALKVERARWKPLEAMYSDAIGFIRSRMSDYQTKLVRENKELQAKIAAKVSSGYIKIETGVKKLEAVATPEKEVATDAGLVQFREVKKLKINDQSLIPRMFLAPDETLITMALKNGEVVPGCEIETLQVPANYR